MPKSFKRKLNIEIFIDKVTVSKRFFSFYYEFRLNGVLREDDIYSSSHSRNPSSMRRWLKKDYAVELVMQKIFG